MKPTIISFDRHGTGMAHENVDVSSLSALVSKSRQAKGFVWAGLMNPKDTTLAEYEKALDLHPLAVADAASGKQQPKIQNYPQHLFVVAWTLQRPPNFTDIGEVMIFVRDGLVFTVQRGKIDSLHIAKSLQSDARALEAGAVGGLYRILSEVIEDYTDEASEVEHDLELLEKQVFDSRVSESEEEIYRLRQRIGKLSRAVGALDASFRTSREHLDALSVGNEALGPYLADLTDDLAGTTQLVQDQGHALDGVVSSHENNIARGQGEDTRKISAIAALLSIPAVVGGLYGMNFKDLPLTSTPLGWVWVLAGIAAIDVVMYVIFKKRRWL